MALSDIYRHSAADSNGDQNDLDGLRSLYFQGLMCLVRTYVKKMNNPY